MISKDSFSLPECLAHWTFESVQLLDQHDDLRRDPKVFQRALDSIVSNAQNRQRERIALSAILSVRYLFGRYDLPLQKQTWFGHNSLSVGQHLSWMMITSSFSIILTIIMHIICTLQYGLSVYL